MTALSSLPSLALYIHWPFCLSKCPYCDFNSHVREGIDEKAWCQAFLKAMHALRQQTGPRQLRSIFFGGGTPSLMPPFIVKSLLNEAEHLWQKPDHLEITLEANPNSAEVKRFQAFQEAGINRLSLGIQSLRGADLKFLGRQHSVEEGIRAIKSACQVFDRVSFDLIYARTQQTLADWQQELQEALEFGTDHMSLYQLTIEPGTAFAPQFARGDFTLPDADQSADFYELTQSIMSAAGLPAYEISNHAKMGHESQHNLTYWRYGDYGGIGPGAHGRLSYKDKEGQFHKIATRHHRAPEVWLNAVLQDGDYETQEAVTLKEQASERLMMGLRLKDPFDMALLPRDWLSLAKIAHLEKAGYIHFMEQRYLTPTAAGHQCLNRVLSYLLAS